MYIITSVNVTECQIFCVDILQLGLSKVENNINYTVHFDVVFPCTTFQTRVYPVFLVFPLLYATYCRYVDNFCTRCNYFLEYFLRPCNF